MKVILTKDVDILGDSGEIVQVADGFARNYLLPRKLAVVATQGSLKDLETRIQKLRAKAEKKHQEDLQKAEKITALELITLEAVANEDTGKLFGTVTTKELTAVLREKTGLEIDRKNVNVNHPVNQVGDYIVNVKFSPKVSAEVALKVTPVKADGEAPAKKKPRAKKEVAEDVAAEE